MRKSVRLRCLATGLALAVTVSSVVTGGYGSSRYAFAATEKSALKKTEARKTYDDVVTNEVAFKDAEDWENTMSASFAGDNEEIAAGSELAFTMTISEAAYNSMKAEDYIKIEAGFFQEENNWDTMVKLGWPQFSPADFTKNADGTYSANVKMTFEQKADKFQSLLVRGVGTGFSGSVTIQGLTVTRAEGEPVLTPQDPTIIGNFAEGIDGWTSEAGYDYSHGKADSAQKTEQTEVEYDKDSKSLKVKLDYSADLSSGWSEAKVKGTFKAVNVKNYNLVSFTLTYPSSMETVRTKIFMNDKTGATTLLDGEGSFRTKTVKDLGNGLSTATIRGSFTPKDVEVESIVIGIVGPYADLKEVRISDVKIGQLDASEDYVEITEKLDAQGDVADLSGMAAEVKLVDGDATNSTKALAAYLAGLQKSGQVLFGHQNSTFRSVRDNGETSDIKDITGSEAGLFGIDTLALAGMETGKKTRQEALDASVAATKKAYNGGSLVSLSCHMPNFTNSKIKATGDARYPYDFTECDFNESKDLTPCADYILEGGEYNPQFNAYLDIIADYALELQKDDIPVLFRPFHENSGGWFWWGSAVSVESYQAMWRYMVNYLEDKGVHNFLYVYSPNGPVSNGTEYLERYPGDAYVDVLGFDYYDDYADANVYTGDNFFDALGKSCDVVASLAEKKNKIPAIAETGIRITGAGRDSLMVSGNPTKDKDWYNKVVNTASSHNIPYFLLWANFDSANFFVPYKYNDTLGQEMINDFIKSYNNEKSIFGNGTNFYTTGDSAAAGGAASKADDVKLDGYSKEANGYMISPKNYAVIKEACDIKAYVKNASKVEFQVKAADDKEAITVPARNEGNVYTGTITADILKQLGETSTGTVTLVADGQEFGTAKFINFNKDADVLSKEIFDNFEYYYGNDGLLQSKYGSHNSAAGCSSSMSLNGAEKAEGDYSGAFNYTLSFKGSEVWTGGLGRLFDADKTDFSEYNAVSMWVKPDGNGQKLVVQLNDDYEAYLTDFVKGTNAQYVTIPFSKFIKKGTTDESIDAKNITNFKIWCNSVPENFNGQKDDNGNYTVNGQILFDAIKAVKISDADLAKADSNGLIISDQPLKEQSGDTPNDNNNNNQDKVTKPKKVTLVSVKKKSSSKAVLKWKKAADASGYQIYMKTGKKGKFKLVKTINKKTKVSYTASKLKKKKTYFFKVRAYKTVSGKKSYGAYSKTKSIALK